jgi:hypothetical protein
MGEMNRMYGVMKYVQSFSKEHQREICLGRYGLYRRIMLQKHLTSCHTQNRFSFTTCTITLFHYKCNISKAFCICQWHSQELLWGGLTNSVEDRGQRMGIWVW